MAGSAEIGSLRVALGIDSAQFATGIKKAQSGLGVLGASIKSFAIGAAAALSFAAITRSITSAIDKADELGKTAQKIGLPVEALSKLAYSARLADVSLEQLSTGVGKLSKNMAAIQGGSGGDAGKALAAIGVSAVDATGKLRPTEQVILDISEKFSLMKDGAGKTALAMAIFGKSGAELIPLLNAGREGLKANADEALRLGQVYDTKTAKAAEQFNDNLTRLKSAMEGLANQAMVALIDKFVTFTDYLVELSKSDSARKFFNDLDGFITSTIEEFNKLAKAVSTVGIIFDVLTDGTPGFEKIDAIKKRIEGLSAVTVDAKENIDLLNSLDIGKPQITSRPLADAPAFTSEAGPKKLSEAFLQSQFDAKQLNLGILALSKGTDQLTESAVTLGQEMAQSIGAELTGWLDQAIAGTLDLSDALLGVLKNLTNLALNSAFNTLFTNASNPVQGGGILGGIGKLFGFANGGSFNVGGSGGIDSQLVAFKASPNERVSVTKPGQGMGGTAELKLVVNDYRTNAPAIERGKDPSGNLMLTLRDMVDQRIEGRYGATPQKVRR